jgi:threonine/homoserine/homoserine lactone efflux protein
LSGLQCAIGHTIVEAPLVFGLALGLSAVLSATSVRLIGIIGGSVLLIFAALQFLQASRKVNMESKKLPGTWQRRPGIVMGVVFTALNPFFILWWLSVGSALISQAILLGALGGVALMYASHIWMDYAWLGGTAAVAGHGRLLLGRWFRALLVILGAAMAYFGIMFILSAVS